jgi:hypothetical protein
MRMRRALRVRLRARQTQENPMTRITPRLREQGKCEHNGHRLCSTQCPQRNIDGTLREPPSFMLLCLICFNTGCRIPIGGKSPTIDRWIEMHRTSP